MTLVDRVEYYKRLARWAESEAVVPILSDPEVENVTKFLDTLLRFRTPDPSHD